MESFYWLEGVSNEQSERHRCGYSAQRVDGGNWCVGLGKVKSGEGYPLPCPKATHE